MRTFISIGVFTVIIILYALQGGVNAQTPLSGCATLNNAGETYVLTQDISNAPSNCMTIVADNVTLDCQGHAIDGVGNGYGIYKYYRTAGKNLTVRNCVVTDWNTGIFLYLADNSVISDNVLDNAYTGIRVQYSPSVVISGNEIRNFRQGVWMRSSDNSVITGNRFLGIDAYLYPENYSYSGVSVNYYGSGIRIENNEITDAGIYGVYLMLYRGGGNVVTGNHIRTSHTGYLYNDQSGIYAAGVEGTEITDNTVVGGFLHGILAYGRYFTITGNSVTGNYLGVDVIGISNGSGYAGDGSSTFAVVSDNKVYENESRGITLWDAFDNIVERNDIYGNGVGIDLYYAYRNRIANNTVHNNYLWGGMSIHASSDCVIEDNDVIENGEIGIEISTVNTGHGYLGDGLVMNRNTICGNETLDVRINPWMSPQFSKFSGLGNTCQNVLGWHDDGLSGCTVKCIPDNMPPIANAGPDQTVEMTSCAGASVTLDGSGSSDPDGDALTYAWTWNGGSVSGVNPSVTLPYGTTTVTLSVEDGKGGTSTDTVNISVVDTTAPGLNVTVEPDLLWPPNHKYVKVIPTVSMSDACVSNTNVELVSVTSNEPDNGLGDGDTANDIVINSDGSISLRAERSGTGSGRVYTITYKATDIAGNVTVASATVVVPHNR